MPHDSSAGGADLAFRIGLILSGLDLRGAEGERSEEGKTEGVEGGEAREKVGEKEGKERGEEERKREDGRSVRDEGGRSEEEKESWRQIGGEKRGETLDQRLTRIEE